MNEQLKKLAELAEFEPMAGGYHGYDDHLERFAELVRQDEREKFADKYLEANYKYASLLQAVTDPENQPSQFGTVTDEYMEQAVLNEREACAKLCENGAFLHDQAPDALFGRAVARAIRARGNT